MDSPHTLAGLRTGRLTRYTDRPSKLVLINFGLSGKMVLMVLREQYERLERHLRAAGHPRIEMTFADVAKTIGERVAAQRIRASRMVGQ